MHSSQFLTFSLGSEFSRIVWNLCIKIKKPCIEESLINLFNLLSIQTFLTIWIWIKINFRCMKQKNSMFIFSVIDNRLSNLITRMYLWYVSIATNVHFCSLLYISTQREIIDTRINCCSANPNVFYFIHFASLSSKLPGIFSIVSTFFKIFLHHLINWIYFHHLIIRWFLQLGLIKILHSYRRE